MRTQWLAHRLGIADVEPGRDLPVAGTLAARLPRLRDIQEAAKGTRPDSYPNVQNASIRGTDFRTPWNTLQVRGSSAGPGMWNGCSEREHYSISQPERPCGTTNQGQTGLRRILKKYE
jgi:hypothetical protein